MVRIANFRPGVQIAYVPIHARENSLYAQSCDLGHPDVEYGFVTEVREQGAIVFCRFWRKGMIGELRTTANSESVHPDDLLIAKVCSQEYVNDLLGELYPNGITIEININARRIVPDAMHLVTKVNWQETFPEDHWRSADFSRHLNTLLNMAISRLLEIEKERQGAEKEINKEAYL